MRRFWLANPETRREAANLSVFRDIAQIHDEMSRLFDDFAAGVIPAARAVQAPVVPKMDLYRKDGKIFLEMESLDRPKDVDLKVYPDRVVLRRSGRKRKRKSPNASFGGAKPWQLLPRDPDARRG